MQIWHGYTIMQLTDALAAQKISLSEIARRWGRHYSSISRTASGSRQPSFEDMVRAYVWSEGAVGFDDWIELHRADLEAAGILPKGWKRNG